MWNRSKFSWIAILLCDVLMQTAGLTNPIHVPQFIFEGSGRNIRHLPCVSRRTGETGVCMFAFTCVKANGTHLGTCIDRFYFGSCCKIDEEPDIFPQDNTIEEGSSRPFVTTHSSIESNDIPVYFPISKPESVSSTQSSLSIIAMQKTTISTLQKISTKKPDALSNVVTEPSSLSSIFQTVQNYSYGKPNTPSSRPVQNHSTYGSQKPTIHITTLMTTKKPSRPGTQKPSKNPTNITTNATIVPSLIYNFTENPSPTTREPVQTTMTTPVVLTAERITPGTRFPPRNATTTRPTQTITKKPISTGIKKPVATTTKTPNSNIPIRRPTTTARPLPVSNVVTGPPSFSTERPHVTTIKITQGNRPPLITTQKSQSTVATMKPTILATEDIPYGGYKPITKRPIIVEYNEITTSKPNATTERPITSTTTARTKPFVKPTKITTTDITLKPVHLTTEMTRPISLGNKPMIGVIKPKPTEKPTKPSTMHSSSRIPTTTPSTPSSSYSSSLPPTTTLPLFIAPFLNETTVKNDLLPSNTSVTDKIDDINDIVDTTYSSGLVTWTINPNDDNTKAPNVSSSASSAEESTEWTPITIPNGWIMIQSPTSEKPSDNLTIKPIKKPTTTSSTATKPGVTESTTREHITKPTLPAVTKPILLSNTTDIIDPIVSIESLNMSDYKQVCGRRLFPESRIVGGERSSFGKWPWQISLRQWRTSTYLHKCGAALVSENWAITAAHCVENVPPSDLLLRIGEYDLANEDEPYGFQERRVQIVASHPQFDPRTFEYDLALLRFYEPLLPFQPNALPICLPDDDANYVGQTAYVTGWGRLYEDGPLPSILQEVPVPVINNTICENMYRNAGYIEHIPNIFICAGWRKGGFDSCEGDSGGPMVIRRQKDKRWILAGIISWGIGCAEPNQPGVYTRISEFREWINQILQF